MSVTIKIKDSKKGLLSKKLGRLKKSFFEKIKQLNIRKLLFAMVIVSSVIFLIFAGYCGSDKTAYLKNKITKHTYECFVKGAVYCKDCKTGKIYKISDNPDFFKKLNSKNFNNNKIKNWKISFNFFTKD